MQILGISVDKIGGHLRDVVTSLLAPTATHLGLDLSFGSDDVLVDDGHVGGGYAVITGTERDVVRQVAQPEGILLDPV